MASSLTTSSTTFSTTSLVTSTKRVRLIQEGDEDKELHCAILEEEEAYKQYQDVCQTSIREEEQDSTLMQEELNPEGEESDIDSVNGSACKQMPVSTSGWKTPFCSFTPRSLQSIDLLKAMLFKSPFDKKNGSSILEQWQGVVGVLIQTGEGMAHGGEKNVYENVTAHAC